MGSTVCTCTPNSARQFFGIRVRILFQFEYHGNRFLVFNDLGMSLCKILGIFINTVVTGGDVDKGKDYFIREVVHQTHD